MSQTEAGLGAELQRIVVERSHDLVTMIDPDGTIVYASPSWLRLLGWEPADVVGTRLTNYCHPEDLERTQDAIAAEAAGRELPPIVTRRRTKDGRWLSLESNATPVLDAAGNVTHILGSARDVSESIELQTRLRDLNALYRIADATARAQTLEELFDEALVALVDASAADRASLRLFDDDGVLRYRVWRDLSETYRAAAERSVTPWPPDAAEAEPVLLEDPQQLIPEARGEGIASIAYIPLVHGGRIVGCFTLDADTPHSWQDREIRLCLTAAYHLASATVRTRARAELRESQEQLETIMRTVDEGIVVQGLDGRRIYANDAAARAAGLTTASELLTGDQTAVFRTFDLLDEHGAPLPVEELPGRKALAGETIERITCYRFHDTGSEHWSVIRANPIRNERGEVVASVSVIHDITDLRLTEAQARESAALLEGVFRNAPVGLAFLDRELRFRRVNDELVEINGIAAAELLGRTVSDVSPGLESQLAEPIARVLESGEPVLAREVSSERPAAPGAKRIWRSSWYPVRDERGEIVGVGGVVDDITRERRAEERIRFLARASELLNRTLDIEVTLRALAEVAVPAFAGHVTVDVVEDGALRCVGARHVDPAKTELMLRLREEYPPTVVDHPVQRALRTGEPQVVADVQAEAASMAHDERHAAAIAELENESGIVVPLIARDSAFGAITFGSVPPQPPFGPADLELAVELGRRASAALDNARLYEQAQARAHAAEALEVVDDGVFLIDGDGIVRLWNPAAAGTFRVPAEKAIGRPVAESIEGWETFAGSSRRPRTIPVSVRGDERWLSVSAVRFLGGTVYAFRDLTQEHAIEQLRSDFVSTVSHELRTPLAAIYGAALTLQRDDVHLEESQRTGLLDVISSEADRLARIVNDILWASRLDSGQMGVTIGRCDAGALAEQVVGALRSHAPETITVDVEAEAELPPVAADGDKLRQVLTNLVDNAIKYSPDGGRVRVFVGGRGNRIRFRVQDEGLGIPPSEQSRIFEKFFRLDPQLTRAFGGTALGLYICRELIERMHGRIGVNSDGRSGSTFWFELPTAQ